MPLLFECRTEIFIEYNKHFLHPEFTNLLQYWACMVARILFVPDKCKEFLLIVLHPVGHRFLH